MELCLYYSPGLNEQILTLVTQSFGIEQQALSQELPVGPAPKILVLSYEYFLRNGMSDVPNLLGVFLVLKQQNQYQQVRVPEDVLLDFSTKEINPVKLKNLIKSADLRWQLECLKTERDAHLLRLKELNNIGISLSREKDPVKLLNKILQKSRAITSADAGSLYLVEGDEESGKLLRFKISQNDSVQVHYEEFQMPITKGSIAGYVAATGQTLNIPDVYQLGADCEYHFNQHYDESTGYRTTSMLTAPMTDHQGHITGIIQLINRKKDASVKLTQKNYKEWVRSFDQNDEELINSLASQAAVALDNSTLIKSIQHLFEGFVTAAVTAIESRDPTTSGHSFRVANLTVALAALVDRSTTGRCAGIHFSTDEIKEMRYAALLHDFGKVGVRENVLVKSKKLYPFQVDLIRQRFEYMKKAWEAEYYRSKFNLLRSAGSENFETQFAPLEKAFENRLGSLDDYYQFILQSNEPTVLPMGNFDKLLRIASDQDLIAPGSHGPLVSGEEIQFLSIRKGNLNERERSEIQSHVTHTFLFLSKIPWTSELRDVPKIAYGHHEKMDGSGYPNRLRGEDIPVQTRIMTISDIYDALTAADRPYKRSVPSDNALDIIAEEVKQQQLDPELFQLFVEGKVYQLANSKP
ncbi:GAF domain-containing protein [bacterium]|nr:GAF domain-containing protein [bacterium]MCI0602573.1 GAF domain-containing protein [bacterium]